MVDTYTLSTLLFYHAPLLCIIICAYMFFSLQRNGLAPREYVLLRLLIAGCVFSMAAEVLSGMILYKLLNWDIRSFFVISDISYTIVLLNTAVFGRFCVSRLHHPSRMLCIVLQEMICVTALMILGRIIFTKTGLFTYCDKNGEATFGPLDSVQTVGILLCNLVIILIIFASLKDKNEYVSRENNHQLLISALIMTFVTLIYVLLYLPYVLWIGYMLATLYLFIGLQGMMIYSDELTSLKNRRRMLLDISKRENSSETEKGSETAGCAWGYIICDVNDFKQINDTYGHNAGDRALTLLAAVLNDAALRSGAKAYRIGGDEFAVLISSDDEHLAQSLCSEIDSELEACILRENLPFKFSVSSGYAVSSDSSGMSILEIMELADQRMYERKRERKQLR